MNQPTFVQRNRAPLIFIALGALALTASIVWAIAKNQPQIVDFTVQSIDGGSITLSEYRGQVVALNFWASWCIPCREEMPMLAEYYKQHQDEGFILIAINVGEDADTARDFMVEFDTGFPIALDPDAELADELGIGGLPVTLIIAPDGSIAYRHAGIISVELLDAQVQAAAD